MCVALENYSPDCAVGAQFDLNFKAAAGLVNTCGLSRPTTLRATSQLLPVTVPYRWEGQNYSVPLDKHNNELGGGQLWYNYTLPANGGSWEYDNSGENSPAESGLVFSYAPCP